EGTQRQAAGRTDHGWSPDFWAAPAWIRAGGSRGIDRANVCANDCGGLYARGAAPARARASGFSRRTRGCLTARAVWIGPFRCLTATFWAKKKPIVNWVSHLMSTM